MCAKAGWVILKDMVWFSRATFLLSGCLSSVCPLSLSSLTGFRPNLVLVLHPLMPPMSIVSPSYTPSSPVCFLSYHSKKYFLILFSPSGLCLLELQVKLEDIISYNQQNLFHNNSPPPLSPFHHPPHTNHHHGRGQRNTSSLSEKPPFVLPPALVGSLSSSDRGERTNRHRGKEALMRMKSRS